jgi:cyclase
MLSRRTAIGRIATAGIGISSALTGGFGARRVDAQGSALIPPAPDARYPQVPSWETEFREIAPNVYAYIQAGGPGRNNVAVSDAGIIIGDDGVMVIDALAAPVHAKNFIAAIRTVTDKPFRHLINTHHHFDHVAGNQYFVPAEVISHPHCREQMVRAAATTPAVWTAREGWAAGGEERRVVPASITIDGKTTYYYGKTIVEIIPMTPAHTYGDLAIYMPQHRVLFAGDIAFFYVAPFANNSHVTRWLEWIVRILRMDVETIVPGHGPIGGKSHLAEMSEYFEALKREARRRYDARMTVGAAAAEIRMGRFDNWIGPERIVMNTLRLYQEFAGTLTPDFDTEGMRVASEEYNSIKTRNNR